MKNRISLFETRDSLKDFLKKNNSGFSEALKGLEFEIGQVREENSKDLDFSLYTKKYFVPDSFKLYKEKRNLLSTNYSPYDLSVSQKTRSREVSRVMSGPKIERIRFYFYKDEEILGQKCRIFLEDEKIENGHYDILSEKHSDGGLIRFPVESIKIEEFYSYWGMKKDLVQRVMFEINERRTLLSKIDVLEEI